MGRTCAEPEEIELTAIGVELNVLLNVPGPHPQMQLLRYLDMHRTAFTHR